MAARDVCTFVDGLKDMINAAMVVDANVNLLLKRADERLELMLYFNEGFTCITGAHWRGSTLHAEVESSDACNMDDAFRAMLSESMVAIKDPMRTFETVEITDVDTCGNEELMQRIQAYASA